MWIETGKEKTGEDILRYQIKVYYPLLSRGEQIRFDFIYGQVIKETDLGAALLSLHSSLKGEFKPKFVTIC